MAPKQILIDCWCNFGVLKNEAPSWIDNFSLLEASGGGFGLDFGFAWGSILGSQAP